MIRELGGSSKYISSPNALQTSSSECTLSLSLEIENPSAGWIAYSSWNLLWIIPAVYDEGLLVFGVLSNELDIVGFEYNLRFVASDDADPTNYAYDEFTLTFDQDTEACE